MISWKWQLHWSPKLLSKPIWSFRRLLLRQRKDLLYGPNYCCPLCYLSCGSCKRSRLQRLQCVSFVFQTGEEAEKREARLPCFRDTARADNVQLQGLCSTRGQGSSSQDLQKHIAAVTCRLSQTAPVPSRLGKQTQLLPAHTCPALLEPVTKQHFGNVAVWNTEISTARQLLTELPSCRTGKQGWWHPYLLPSLDMLSFPLLSPAGGLPTQSQLLPLTLQRLTPTCLIYSSPANYQKHLAMKSLN